MAPIVSAPAAVVAGTSYTKAKSSINRRKQPSRTKLFRPRAFAQTCPADAKVHIVEFLDPACETCRSFYPFVKDLMKANRDKIRLSLRYAPFHAGSDNVVRILEAARKQGKFWETLEAVLATQPRWAPNHRAEVELLWPQLGNLGLDFERIKRDMYAPEIDRVIAQDLADAKALNVTKTPEFFVNAVPCRASAMPLKKLVPRRAKPLMEDILTTM